MAGEMEQQRTANVVLTADVDPYRQSIQAAGNDTQRLTDRVDRLTKSLDNLAKSTGKKLTIFGAGTLASITATTAAFASFDKQMTQLKSTAEVTNRNYDSMVRGVNSLRKEFGLTTGTAVELTKTINGFRDFTRPVGDLAETFVRLGAAVGEAPTQLAQGMLQLQRSMGTSQNDTKRYANVLTDLSTKSGVAAGSILQFSQAIAPIGKIAGMQQSEIMGVATAFNKAGQDGYLAANAFNKMLSDIMHSVQTGSPDLAKYANLIGVTVDQFKTMNKTEAITSIFSELNRLGPNAIQILNRMGLDGMRMQNAIAGVSQQSGGIGAAVASAVASYQNGDSSLQKGSEAALDGVSDRMAKLSEETKIFGETVGSAFAPAAEKFIGGLDSLVATANAVAASPLGKIAGWITGIGGAIAMVSGPLLAFAGTIGALAGGRALMRNWVTQGVRDQWNQSLGVGARSTAHTNIAAGNSNFAQRGLYRGGQAIGTIIPPLAPGQAGYISQGAGAVVRGGTFGLNLLRGAYSPGIHPFDPGARVRVFATDAERAAGQGVGPRGMFSPTFTQGTGGSSGVVRGAMLGGNFGHAFAAGTGDLVRRFTPHFTPPPVFGGLGPNLGYAARTGLGFVGSVGGAAAGLTGVVGRGVAMGGLNMLRNIGPLGGTMLAGTAAMMYKSAADNATQFDLGAQELAPIDAYNASLGKATTSLQDFTASLRKAANAADPKVRGGGTKVTNADLLEGTAPGREYTDPRLKTMNEQQATSWLSLQMKDADPAAKQAIKLDLLQRFKDPAKVERIMGKAGQGRFDLSGMMSPIFDHMGGGIGDGFGLGWWGADKPKAQFEALDDAMKFAVVDATKRGGRKGGRLQNLVNLNQFMQTAGTAAVNEKLGNVEQNQIDKFLNDHFFGGDAEIGGEVWKSINTSDIYSEFETGGNVAGLQEMWKQILGSNNREATDGLLSTMGLNRRAVRRGLRDDSGRHRIYTRSNIGLEELTRNTVSPEDRYRAMLARTDAGALFANNSVIQKAIQPGFTNDANAQMAAADEMVRVMRKAGMSYAEIDGKLIRFQAAVQDTTDPLYQLASAARSIGSQQLQFQLPYMKSGQVFTEVAGGFQERIDALTPGEGRRLTPDAANERKRAIAEYKQFELSERNRVMAMYRQQEEFDIAKERSNYEFYQVQLPRMEEQFGISRERAWEDYNISRERAELQFNISRQRAAQQYAISLKDSYQDFHISRRRAEADFAHQQELMAKQMAQQQYNIYERLKVARTWSGTSLVMNSQEQLTQMRQQNDDLDRLRKMGMSKLAIQQMNFTSPENAQQLERFMLDARQNPELIGQLNRQAKQRMKQGKELATDPANPQWEEMQRQFRLSMSRGADDFERAMSRNRRNYHISMKQSQEDFGRTMDQNAADMKRNMNRSAADFDRAVSQMKDDYKRQQDNAAKDLKRSQRELTWSLEETLERAIKKLSGAAKEQVKVIRDEVIALNEFLRNNEIEITIKTEFARNRTEKGLIETDLKTPSDRKPPTNHTGGVYRGSQLVWVAETANEAVVPLNRHGAEFMAAVLSRYADEAKGVRTSGRSVPVGGGQAVHNYRVDKSTNFTGPVHVHGVQDPRAMAEKARQEARRKKLTKGTR